jgi:hypothetical protein
MYNFSPATTSDYEKCNPQLSQKWNFLLRELDYNTALEFSPRAFFGVLINKANKLELLSHLKL